MKIVNEITKYFVLNKLQTYYPGVRKTTSKYYLAKGEIHRNCLIIRNQKMCWEVMRTGTIQLALLFNFLTELSAINLFLIVCKPRNVGTSS